MANNKTIALAMIVKGTKDEAKLLDQCLASVHEHVDGIFLNINHAKGKKIDKEVLKIADKYETVFYETEWNNDFVEARTFIFDKVPKDFDFVMWLDTDDTIDTPENIKYVINSLQPQQQGIYINYDYDHDEFGNVTLSHWVARIVRNNGSYAWRASISGNGVSVHETLNELTPRPKAMSNDFNVIHHAGADRRSASLIRNIKLLEGMFKEQQSNGKFDPRTLYYLATHYYDANILEDAKALLEHYLTLSGWSEERSEALVYLGNIAIRYNMDDEAHRRFLAAIGEFQNNPRPYIGLAELDFIKGRYEESAGWIEKCIALPETMSGMVKTPMENSYKAYMLGAQSCANIGGIQLNKAQKYIKSAIKLRPTDPDALRARDLIAKLIDNRDDIKAANRLITKLVDDKQENKVLSFINSLPDDVQDNPIILNNRFKFTEPHKYGNKDIAIYCGQGPLGIWGYWSLKDGIGGSEEAVVQLSRQLAKLGWRVTIFATPGDRAGLDPEADGFVEWKQYYEYNPKDEYNIIVSWRNPSFFDAKINAKKKYLWLHDVMERAEFFKERLDNIDRVIFVGQYHADLYKDLMPKEKIFVSGNGIDPNAFDTPKEKRKKNRLIYMSAYNRGLKVLLTNWDKVKKAIPDATLDIYYGWNSYDALNSDNPERMAWKQSIVDLINSCDGVTDHGRIGHEQIIKEIKTADYFAYPCIFDEVYCISIVKAMAGGAYPITSDFAELNSYKKNGGSFVHYNYGDIDKFSEDYINTLIETMKNGVSDEERTRISKKALNKYTWESTAMGWDKDFND